MSIGHNGLTRVAAIALTTTALAACANEADEVDQAPPLKACTDRVTSRGVGTSPSIELQGVGTSPSILSTRTCDDRDER